MRNSPRLPIISLLIAVIVGAYAAVGVSQNNGPLTELQLGEIALALTAAIFGFQGLVSVLVEGQELRPGRTFGRATGPLSIGIVLFSIVLFVIAVLLAYGITDKWRIEAIGTLAGVGCLVLSVLLVFYKEAFVGDESRFDNRKDGVPW